MPSEQIGSAFVTIGLDAKGLEPGLNAAKSSVASATKDMSGMGEKISAGLRNTFSKDAGNFESVGKNLGNSLTQGMEQRFGAIGGMAGSAAAALGPVGIAAGVVGAALVAVGVSSVGVASSFQSAMSSVNAVLGGTKEDLATLSAAAREAGATTAFSATQAAEALGALASAGYTVEESTSALTATLDLAGAGGMELERAAQMLTTDLSVFSLKADQATRVTDILATAANKSNSGVAEMGDALAKVGGTANATGLSIEQTTAVLEVMAGQGIKGAEAGTKLNAVLGALTVASSSMATKNQTNAMAEMGITADQLNPTLHTQAEIFGLLNEKHMTGAQSLAIFGLENNSAASYVAANSAKIGEFEGQLTSCDGAASAMSATMNNNLKGAMAEMSSAVEEAQISIGNLLLPALTSIVQGATGVVAGATEMGQAFGSLVVESDAFQAVSAAISAVGDVVSTTFGNFVSLVRPAWDALGGGIAVLGVLQRAFNALTAPITLVFTALSTVVGILGKVATAISPVASAIGGALVTAIKTASAYVKAFTEAFSNLGPIKTFQSVIEGAADIAGKVWDGLSTAIPKAFEGAFNAVKTLVTGFITWVGDALGAGDIGTKITDGIKNSLGEGITGWIGSISGRANEILGAGKEIGDKTATGIKTDEELQKAAAEALNTPEALKAAEEAGGEIADKTLSGFAKQAQMSGLSDSAMLAMINGQGNDSKIKEYVYDLKGKVVKYWYDAAKSGPKIAYLSIDDVFATSGQQDWMNGEAVGYAPTAEQLLAKLGLSDNIISQMKPLAQAKIGKSIDDIKKSFEDGSKKLFDFAPAAQTLDSFSAQLSSQLRGLVTNVGKQIEDLGNVPAYEKTRAIWTKEGQALIDALAMPMGVEGFAAVKSALTGISDWTTVWAGTFGDTAGDAAIEYKEKLLAGISDMGPYVSQEFGRIGSEASAAIEDGFLSLDDKILLDSLLAQAAVLKEIAPAEYEAAGGDIVVALVEGIKSGDIAGPAAAKAKEGIDAIKATLAEGASLENYGALGEQYYNLAKAMGSKWTQGMQEDAEESMRLYKENLGGAITDIKAFAEDGMATAGGMASAAFSDHVFTDDDLISLQTKLLPMLEMVEEKSPEYFKSAAGKSWLAFEQAIKDGDPDEIVRTYKQLGKDSGEGFSKSLLDGAKLDITLAQLKADPSTYAKYISDPMVYAANSGYEQTKTVLKQVIDAYKLEGMDSEYLKTKLLEAFVGVENYIPGWVQRLNTALSSGRISLGQYLATYEYYSSVLDEADKKTEKSTQTTEKSTKATKDKTSALDLNRLVLAALNSEMSRTRDLSGAGMTITFSPARVIADEAKNALILGAQIGSRFLSEGGNAVKIGFDQWGREVAVIGKVEQERWAKSGELISANIKTSSDTAATTTKDAATAGKGIHVAGITDGTTLFLTNMGTASTNLGAGIRQAVTDLTNRLNLSGGNFQSRIDIGAANHQFKIENAAANAASQSNSMANYLRSQGVSVADYGYSKGVAAGNWIYEKGVGAGNAISNAANSLAASLPPIFANLNSTLVRSLTPTVTPSVQPSGLHNYGTTSWGTPLHSTDFSSWGRHATGTKTVGPQLAMIGEDGAANPEYVIPTKTKRWDLLFAAMRSYGIPGFAEGTSIGGAAEGAVDADKMTAYFGITGLASMSKQVKKIITDLKDFFRISWAIVKAEGSTYWNQINAVLAAEITSIRDTGWQAAIDIRNTWLSTTAAIMADAKAQWAAYWPSIEPSISSLQSSIVSSFDQAGEGAKNAIDSMVLNSEASLQAFGQSWYDIWGQMVTDMTDAQTKITEGVAVIADALKQISVNVNINANIGGGSSGGGGYIDGGGSVITGGSNGDNNFSDCLFDGFTDTCTGVLVNPLIYTNPQGVTSYINPMTYNSTGGISNYQGAGGNNRSSYQLPNIFRFAKGALVEKPTEAIMGEAGPELALPAKLTRMFVSLADMGVGQGRSSSEKIVIEDHTEHHWYMDGKEVTNTIMDRVMKKMQLRGAVPAR